ncbi:chorismate mutase [Streptococcus oralis]|uniref:chorismate mutase n=1 Tax=Streptococcus oralis TaxID=1303 RepID=UPI0020C8EC9F|nr:chorismate mutase [Streptococcus oralis]MCP9036895.1 chorismate mutase [Streptococcus oralis]MCP9052001.1 chorismate mutase [Streptococcus oralis]MCP9058708.1 chorismate mutase [Streptococcus oralis]MCP9065600.1 chorismate mutase [Streptococcus oralis]MCP9069175.1 chorismate mutase [Streptococcus oralis]
MDLDIIRHEIDQVDDQIVHLLEKRMHLVERVVAVKKVSGKQILDTKREELIFERVRNKVEDKRYQEPIVAIFSDILKRSRAYQDKHIT